MKETLLKQLISQTPSMLSVDGVKLLYQHHFGCGHLLAAPEMVAERVRQEMMATDAWQDSEPAQFIGAGLCRLNLHNPLARKLSPEWIAAMMRVTQEVQGQSSVSAHGDFLQSLDLLKKLAQDGQTPFSGEDLDNYLLRYAAEGYPMVSHSETYHRHYQPAYRVVLSDFAVLLPLIVRMEEKLQSGEPVLAVIDGPCGSGKTTLAQLLSRIFDDAPILPMDHFFLPPELRTPERLSEPGGNIHYERILNEVMEPLATGEAFYYQRFCCSDFTFERVFVPKAPLRIVEGSYSLHPLFQQNWKKAGAVTAYVEVDENTQLERIAARDPELVDMFKNRWIPLEKKYSEAYHIPCWAELRLTSIPWEAGA